MDGYLRQSTASQTRWIGPFVDDTDFKTAETGLTIADTDIKVSKNGAASASKNSGGGTHDVNGNYAVTWDATDTGTVGQLAYTVKVAGALQVWGTYTVLEEAAYDALMAASAPGYVVDQPVNVTKLLGTAWLTPGTAGTPDVNVKLWNALATVALPLVPTTAGRTLDVSAGGEAGVDWANVGSPTTALDLSGTTIKTTQKVDVETIKTNPVVNGGTITFPSNATVASTTGAVGSVTGAVGSVTGAVGSVTGAVGSVTGAVGSVTGNVGGNVTGSVGSVATGGIAAASFAAGAIDAAAIAADAIGSSELAATAATEIANAVAAIAMADPSAVPAVTATLQQTLSWLLALSRNLVTQTSTQQKVYQDDGTTLVATSVHSDDGTTHTRNEWS